MNNIISSKTKAKMITRRRKNSILKSIKKFKSPSRRTPVKSRNSKVVQFKLKKSKEKKIKITALKINSNSQSKNPFFYSNKNFFSKIFFRKNFQNLKLSSESRIHSPHLQFAQKAKDCLSDIDNPEHSNLGSGRR